MAHPLAISERRDDPLLRFPHGGHRPHREFLQGTAARDGPEAHRRGKRFLRRRGQGIRDKTHHGKRGQIILLGRRDDLADLAFLPQGRSVHQDEDHAEGISIHPAGEDKEVGGRGKYKFLLYFMLDI